MLFGNAVYPRHSAAFHLLPHDAHAQYHASSLHLSGSKPWQQKVVFALVPLLLLLLFTGCSAVSRRPVPEALIDSVRVVGMPSSIRAWGDLHSEVLQRSLTESVAQADLIYGEDQPTDVLAISGGGSYGAYTAGILCGWTASGTRPVFRMVSGVSIGAVIAPFAFLGSEYDDRLREMARDATPENIYRTLWWTQIVTGDSVADNAPFVRFIGRYFDDDVLRAVAVEHAKGRRLFVATTNLDTSRPVIWDMGAIASSGSPQSLRLFQQVIIASAAIPVFFPPTYIDVECDARTYDEMHVDGGVTGQILLYGQSLTAHEVIANRQPSPRTPTYYVIRNGKLSMAWEPVEPTVRAIASRSISRLIQAQGVGDLWQAYAACRRDGLEFRLASIPNDIELPPDAGFDAATIARLFDHGYALARDGYPWVTEPPGLRQPPPSQ